MQTRGCSGGGRGDGCGDEGDRGRGAGDSSRTMAKRRKDDGLASITVWTRGWRVNGLELLAMHISVVDEVGVARLDDHTDSREQVVFE